MLPVYGRRIGNRLPQHYVTRGLKALSEAIAKECGYATFSRRYRTAPSRAVYVNAVKVAAA